MNHYELELEADLTTNEDGKPKDSYLLAASAGIAKIILRNNYFARDEGGKLYWYKDGVYKQGAENAIRLAVVELFDVLGKGSKFIWTKAKGEEVYNYIQIKAPHLLAVPDIYRINLRNGIYDVKLGELVSHSPTYRTTTQINVYFDPHAPCPNWDKFIHSVFPEGEGKQLGYEIPAWLMVPYTESQKSVVLLGSGANGKSIYLHALLEFLGEENSCNIPLQKLGDRFTTTLLLDKLANVSPDLPNTKLASTSEFKALTGGDYITGEYKHGGQFKFKPYARCLFACNELPDSPDASDGFYRRLNIIEFERKFKEDPEMGRKLKQALTTKRELAGLFNKCLTYLPSVLKHGITETEKMKSIVEEHRRESDPVAQWLDDATMEDENSYIIKSDLFEAYQESGNIGKASKNQVAFGRAVRRYRPSIKTMQKRLGELGTMNVYMGIRLKAPEEGVDWGASDDTFELEGEDLEIVGIELEDVKA